MSSEDPDRTQTDELKRLREQTKSDRKLMEQAAQVLAEIDRASGLRADQADVLVALRIRVEGKERGSLEDLLSTTSDIASKPDLGEVLTGGDEPKETSWPEVEDKKRDWPEL
ncbi:MAG: hypothetical protein M3277_03545 [Actinomycetota bacterium]|nr:hypothetical protein [Actinomycetota bacterium]